MGLEQPRLVGVPRLGLAEQTSKDGVRLLEREGDQRVERGAARELDASLLVRILVAVVRGGAIGAEEVPRRAQGLTPGGSLAQLSDRGGGQRLGV